MNWCNTEWTNPVGVAAGLKACPSAKSVFKKHAYAIWSYLLWEGGADVRRGVPLGIPFQLGGNLTDNLEQELEVSSATVRLYLRVVLAYMAACPSEFPYRIERIRHGRYRMLQNTLPF